MGKTKNKSFGKMLSQNAKKITVMYGDETRTLASVTEESLENMMATSPDAIIPPTAEEAAEGATESSILGLGVCFVQTEFSVYEDSLKSGAKQTMMLASPIYGYDSFAEIVYSNVPSLMGRTNLSLILKNIPDKIEKRIDRFMEKGNEQNTFVVKIPNLVMFHDSIRKGNISKASYFDLVIILFSGGPRRIEKLKKKNKEEYTDKMNALLESTVNVLKDLAVSSAHIELNPLYYLDACEYASEWVREIEKNDVVKKFLRRLVFCTTDPTTLAEFNGQLARELVNNKSIELL